MANIKYLFPKDNFPFISPPRHLRHVSWPRVISPCCSAHPVPELRRHRARQREPAPLHGPRPGRGHQLQRTAGQIFFWRNINRNILSVGWSLVGTSQDERDLEEYLIPNSR